MKLASLWKPLSFASIQTYLAPNWLLWPQYGPELSRLLLRLNDQHCSDAEPVAESTLPTAPLVNHFPNTEAAPSPTHLSLPLKRSQTESSSTVLSTILDKDTVSHHAISTSHKQAKHPTPIASSSVQPPPTQVQIVDTTRRLSYYHDHCSQGYAPPASVLAAALATLPPPTPSYMPNWTHPTFPSYTTASFTPPLALNSVPHHPYALWGQIPMMPPSSWQPLVLQIASNRSSAASQGIAEPPSAVFNSQNVSNEKKNT